LEGKKEKYAFSSIWERYKYSRHDNITGICNRNKIIMAMNLINMQYYALNRT